MIKLDINSLLEEYQNNKEYMSIEEQYEENNVPYYKITRY
jgi:hypothetical protein